MLCVTAEKWSPALQIRTVLLSIQALLSAPNPDDPLANDVAEQWKANESAAISTGLLDHNNYINFLLNLSSEISGLIYIRILLRVKNWLSLKFFLLIRTCDSKTHYIYFVS